MTRTRSLLAILLFFLILLARSESQAVIYKYVNAKGIPTFADDLQNVPEQYRSQAVVVSGGNDYDAYAEQQKARLAAESRDPSAQQAVAPAKVGEPISSRLIRSGIAAGLFVVILFVIANIHGLHEQAHALSRIRMVLVLLLFAFLGFTHAGDIAGLFGKAGEAVSNPIASIQEQSAERGKKAAESYKAIDKVLEQRAHEEEARLKEIDKKFDEAERAR